MGKIDLTLCINNDKIGNIKKCYNNIILKRFCWNTTLFFAEKCLKPQIDGLQGGFLEGIIKSGDVRLPNM